MRGSNATYQPLLVFFPPNPPPLGVEIALPRGSRQVQSNAPDTLRDFVGELFYAPLSSRLAAGEMRADMAAKLDDYTKLRAAFLGDLRAHIYGIRAADGATRLRMNAEFAREQTPGLVSLEVTADEIRQDLYRAHGLGGSVFDWNENRQWKLGAGSLKVERAKNAVLEYQVQRAAVYFQDGLLPSQRRLLQEVAMEMEDEIFRSESLPLANYGFMFFSPATARVRIPSGMPGEAAANLERFQSLKTALKTEIKDAVYAADARKFISFRSKDMEELAHRQTLRLGELEDLAEEIRRDLVQFPAVKRPDVPDPIPQQIENLLVEFQRDRDGIQRRLAERIRAAHREVAPPASPDPADRADFRDRLVAAAEKANKEFEVENSAEIAGLETDLEAIVALVEEHIPPNDEVLLAGSAAAVVEAFVTRQRRLESAFEYHTAIFEPGLSPEQRRLLFGGAVRLMRLPLPGGEPLPGILPGTLLPVREVGR